MPQFIKDLVHFLDPNDFSTSIRPLCRYLFDIKEDKNVMVQPLPDFLIKEEESKDK